MYSHSISKFGIIVLFSFGLLSLISCSNESKSETTNIKLKKTTVTDNGNKIIFSPDNPGLKLFKYEKSVLGTSIISVIAPARIVASIQDEIAQKDKIILFENADITSIYSQYRQSKINLEKSKKNMDRIRDMFNNHTATAKEVTDAESDVENSKTTLAEMESKLRVAGYNPIELESSKPQTIWLISDVSESQIKDVQKFERVKIKFSSYPEDIFYGDVSSIGDVVDPVTRTIKVKIVLANKNKKLIPGMYARVDFGDPVKDVIIIPQTAVVTVDGKDYVFVKVGEGVFERRNVITRNSVDKNIIITQGISNGEDYVSDGAILLKGLSFGF